MLQHRSRFPWKPTDNLGSNSSKEVSLLVLCCQIQPLDVKETTGSFGLALVCGMTVVCPCFLVLCSVLRLIREPYIPYTMTAFEK